MYVCVNTGSKVKGQCKCLCEYRVKGQIKVKGQCKCLREYRVKGQIIERVVALFPIPGSSLAK